MQQLRPTRSRRAAAGMQYATVVGLIAVVALAAVAASGTAMRGLLAKVGNTIGGVANTGDASGANSGPAIIAGNYTQANFSLAGLTATLSGSTLISAAVSGGTPPFTVTAVGNGTNCAASLAAGTITLKSTALSGSCSYTVQDSAGQSASGNILVSASAYPLSCNTLYTAQSTLPDGTYAIKPSASVLSAYCLMSDFGGGWTLVMNAYGGPSNTLVAWDTNTDVNAPPTVNGTQPQKFADATINALGSGPIRVRSPYGGDYFFVGCTYAHTVDATGNCLTSWSNPAGTTGQKIGQPGSPGFHQGISNWQNSSPFPNTVITNDNYDNGSGCCVPWYATNATGSNACGGQGTGCNLQVYKR